jgi:hypothetical protein
MHTHCNTLVIEVHFVKFHQNPSKDSKFILTSLFMPINKITIK